jgi:nitroreductase
MELFEAFEKRHSYRGPFTDAFVPRDDLRAIVQAGLLAPSGKNLQTTEFIIVDEPGLLERIAEMNPANAAMRDAKAYVVCVIDKNAASAYEGFSFQVEDCAAAVENMLLAVTGLGYASVWIDGWLRAGGRAERIAELLGVPPHKQVRILLPVGVPAELRGQPEKKPFEERAFLNGYKA